MHPDFRHLFDDIPTNPKASILGALLDQMLARLRHVLAPEREAEGAGAARCYAALQRHRAHMETQVDRALKENPEVRNGYLRKIEARVSRFERRWAMNPGDWDYDPPRHIVGWAELVNLARRQGALDREPPPAKTVAQRIEVPGSDPAFDKHLEASAREART